MTKIEYLKNGPGALRGSVRTVDSRSAKALVGLGYARYYKTRAVEPAPQPQVIPKKEESDKTTEPASEKRQYKRRDLKAEK